MTESMTDTQESTKLPTKFRQHALGWLGWQHRLSKAEATDILDGISTPNSKNGRLRQEAIDVAGYIEHSFVPKLVDVSNSSESAK